MTVRNDDKWRPRLLESIESDLVFDYVTSVDEHRDVYDVYKQHLEALSESAFISS